MNVDYEIALGFSATYSIFGQMMMILDNLAVMIVDVMFQNCGKHDPYIGIKNHGYELF